VKRSVAFAKRQLATLIFYSADNTSLFKLLHHRRQKSVRLEVSAMHATSTHVRQSLQISLLTLLCSQNQNKKANFFLRSLKYTSIA
jgi:purine-nucleoside phosphorylase